MHDDFPRIKLERLREEFPGVFETARWVDVGIGWLGLIREFVTAALPHDPSLCVHEIKEKWGTLRIWCDTESLPARLAKSKAEIKSGFVCEACGKEGFLRRPPASGGWAWWRCLCDEHASPDQRSWGTQPTRRTDGMMQFRGAWYRYDRETDQMVPSGPPEGWSR